MNDENEQESICYRKQDFQLVCCILNSGKDSNWFIGRAFFIEGVFIWANIVSAIHQVCSRFWVFGSKFVKIAKVLIR